MIRKIFLKISSICGVCCGILSPIQAPQADIMSSVVREFRNACQAIEFM
ncbi:MAG: hypothetical protein K6C34_04305 [Alphaproteobacteria bacterium]|nr:hypothetical protein [Alphaproteobacteria bacterium]